MQEPEHLTDTAVAEQLVTAEPQQVGDPAHTQESLSSQTPQGDETSGAPVTRVSEQTEATESEAAARQAPTEGARTSRLAELFAQSDLADVLGHGDTLSTPPTWCGGRGRSGPR